MTQAAPEKPRFICLFCDEDTFTDVTPAPKGPCPKRLEVEGIDEHEWWETDAGIGQALFLSKYGPMRGCSAEVNRAYEHALSIARDPKDSS